MWINDLSELTKEENEKDDEYYQGEIGLTVYEGLSPAELDFEKIAKFFYNHGFTYP